MIVTDDAGCAEIAPSICAEPDLRRKMKNGRADPLPYSM
jgi:hypothetical protein